MKAHEFALLAKRIAGSSFGVLQQQVEDYTVGLEAAVAAIDEAKVAATKAQAECKVLLAQAAELKRAREAEFSKRQKFVTQCKKGSVAATKALGKVVARVEEKTIELEELRELSLELSARVGAAEDSCAASRATLVQLNEKLAAEEAQFASCHEVRTPIPSAINCTMSLFFHTTNVHSFSFLPFFSRAGIRGEAVGNCRVELEVGADREAELTRLANSVLG
jgi:hypothetical protein